MKRFITDKSFYLTLITIALPIALQNLIVFGVSMTDTIMVGQLGQIQLSACAQANQPAFVFQLFIFGLAGGASVLAAQYWGKGNVDAINKIIAIVIRIVIISSIILTIVVVCFPEQIMQLYIKSETEVDRQVLSEAVDFLKIVALSYFFFGVSIAFSFILRSVEIVKISVFVSSISFFVNLFFNWVFIFGNIGAPALGIKGSAVATLIARIFEFVIMIIYVFLIDKKLCFKVKYLFSHNAKLFKDYLKYSLPVVTNEFAWALAISIQAAILGKLSTEILAANSIAMVLQQLAILVSFGVGSASAVIVGKKIGEGNIINARSAASTIMIWSLVFGVIGTISILLLRDPFINLYKVDEKIKLLSHNLLAIVAIAVFFMSISVNSLVGVLRGAGDTKYCLKLEMIALWFISLPLGLLSGFIFKWPLLITYACLKIDEPIKAVISYIRTTKKSTYKSVTRSDF